jgi:hypothetical protein
MLDEIFNIKKIAYFPAYPAAVLKSDAIVRIDKNTKHPTILFSPKLNLDKLKSH